MVSGVLVGGHVFAVPDERLIALLYLTIASGAVLAALDIVKSWQWFVQGMGVAVELKIALVVAAGLLPLLRVPLLLIVIAIGSVGSHMPSRYRHFSFLVGGVIDD